MKFIVILFLLFTSIYTLAQQSDSQLAYTYYQAKEYDKAEATLKKNPNNDIGYEAKLKKAMLAYYAGDLLWAKAQFDVLKGATSKLISNDAIQMSHFIHMNYEAEGDNRDLEKMGRPENLLCKRQFQEDFPRQDSLIGYCSPGISNHATLPKNRSLRACFQDEEAVVFTVLKQPNSTGIWKPENKQR